MFARTLPASAPCPLSSFGASLRRPLRSESIFEFFWLGQPVSYPLCQDWRITKTKDYDDQRTNGTGARKIKNLPYGQTHPAAHEPGELVVSTDAGGGGQSGGLAA